VRPSHHARFTLDGVLAQAWEEPKQCTKRNPYDSDWCYASKASDGVEPMCYRGIKSLLIDVQSLAQGLIKPVKSPVRLSWIMAQTQPDSRLVLAVLLQSADVFVDGQVRAKGPYSRHRSLTLSDKGDVV